MADADAGDACAPAARLAVLTPDRQFARQIATTAPLLVALGVVGAVAATRRIWPLLACLLIDVGYAAAYTFRYSPRPGTPAAERAQVDQAEAEARLQEVQALIDAQQRAALAAMVRRTAEVLYERPGRIAGQWAGKSEHLHAVHVADPAGQPGEIARVRILRAEPHSLAAERIG